MTKTQPRPDHALEPARADRPYRPELQGLRALAVWMVVIYHVFLGRVSGGVDVFLFLSALLLSMSFIHRLQDARPLRPLAYWARTFARLLPAAVITIAATLAVVLLIFPQARHPGAVREAAASVIYLQNWNLAAQEVDYYASDDAAASAFQHFWSLSVQGQIFILWPLLFVLVAGALRLVAGPRARRAAGSEPRGRQRRARIWILALVLVVFGAVFAASLAWSVHLTGTNQALAYFDTRTRLWEFALGTLLAVLLPFLRVPPILRGLLGWAGIIALLSCGMLLDVRGAFPGWIAMWPLLATSAVIVAGSSGQRWGVDRLLASRPLVAMGNSSYALYLIHWPLLVIALNLTGRRSADAMTGLIVIGVSVAAAVLLTALVDQPVRAFTAGRRRPGTGSRSPGRRPADRLERQLVVIVMCVGLVLLPSAVLDQRHQKQAETARQAQAQQQQQITDGFEAAQSRGSQAEDAPGQARSAPFTLDYPGAMVLDPSLEVSAADGLPAHPELSAIYGQWAPEWPLCEGPLLPAEPDLAPVCEVVHDPVDPERTVVMIGSSHAEHWSTAMKETAEQNGWRVVALLKAGCTFYSPDGVGLPACQDFSRAATDYVERLSPDAVFAQSTVTSRDDPEDERLIGGFENRVEVLGAMGVEVVGFRDSPRWETKRPECLRQFGVNAPQCVASIDEKMAATDPALHLEQAHGNFSQLDLTTAVCNPQTGICPTTTGNIHVWIDSNHLTRDYVLSAAGLFDEALFASTGWERTDARA